MLFVTDYRLHTYHLLGPKFATAADAVSFFTAVQAQDYLASLWALAVQVILTDIGTEFCGTPELPNELYLAFNDIQHRRTQLKHPHTNGFVERFFRTDKEEFFQSRVPRS